MNRRGFLASLFAAPIAAVAGVQSPPAAAQFLESRQFSVPELIVRIGCDTSEFTAAVDRITAELSTWETLPTSEEIRAQMDGMPSIKITADGKVIDEFYVLL